MPSSDHGTASHMFLMGNQVVGGLHGEYPSLTSLDNNGDLIHTVDFRSVYATLLDRWLRIPSGPVLGGKFAPVEFLTA